MPMEQTRARAKRKGCKPFQSQLDMSELLMRIICTLLGSRRSAEMSHPSAVKHACYMFQESLLHLPVRARAGTLY